MAGVADYSSTPASNTTINSIGIQGTNNAQNFDNGLRQLMADIATARGDGQMASMPYVTKSAGYTVAVTDRGKLIDCTAAVELELPAAATAGAAFYFIAKGNGGAVTLDPNGTENINGSSTSATVADGTSAIVACDGSAWHTLTLGGVSSMAYPTLVSLEGLSLAAGDIIYATAADTLARLAKGTASQQLRMNSGATAPEWVTPATSGAVPIGAVSFFGGTSAPTGWLLCYGQAVSRTTYSDLFAAISTTYGVGDGSTTFNLPDIRGRAIAGQDDMGGTSANRLTNQSGGLDGDTLGATGGAETHALTAAQTPNNDATTSGATGSGGNDDDTVATAHTGTGSAHNNVQPTIILNAIIYAGV